MTDAGDGDHLANFLIPPSASAVYLAISPISAAAYMTVIFFCLVMFTAMISHSFDHLTSAASSCEDDNTITLIFPFNTT